MTEVKIKPCPHCGSDRITVWNIRDGQQVVCKDCKSTSAPTFHGPDGPEATRNQALEAWNRRSAILPDVSGAEPVAWIAPGDMERLPKDRPRSGLVQLASMERCDPLGYCSVPLFAAPPASDLREENETLRKARNAIEAEQASVSGIDGYNYASGHEYGLRRALIILDAVLQTEGK